MSDHVSRRSFIKTSAAVVGAGAALASAKVHGANERIRLGVIGTANRGGQLIGATLEHADAHIVALCDVYAPAAEKWAQKLESAPQVYNDYRAMLARDDIDGVIIATPDHWHALQTIHACEAGKDVYVEKPLAQTIVEGRKMVEVARRTEKIVQVGLHRRSSELYLRLHELVQRGDIGKVTVARAFRLSNMYPDGIGKVPDQEVPVGLDWDMWLGPRAYRPFKETIAPYKFRWWDGYSSQLGNWGVHYFDLIRWMLDVESPVAVSSHGGRFAIDDDRTIPDTMESTFELPSGTLVVFGQYEASGYKMFPFGDIELRGTRGVSYSSPNRVEIYSERGGQFADPAPRMEEIKLASDQHDPTIDHIRNFLDCMRSRKRPNCDVEEGHRSTIFAHLGNIALATKARLSWDAKAERFVDNDAANAMLHYEYRAPWKWKLS